MAGGFYHIGVSPSECALQAKLGGNFALGLKTSPWACQKAKIESPCIFWVERLKMTGGRGIKFELQFVSFINVYLQHSLISSQTLVELWSR